MGNILFITCSKCEGISQISIWSGYTQSITCYQCQFDDYSLSINSINNFNHESYINSS